MNPSPERRIKLASLCQTQIRVSGAGPKKSSPNQGFMRISSCLSMALGHGSWPRIYQTERTNGFLSNSLAATKQVVVPVAARNTEKSVLSAFTKNLFFVSHLSPAIRPVESLLWDRRTGSQGFFAVMTMQRAKQQASVFLALKRRSCMSRSRLFAGLKKSLNWYARNAV